MLFYNLIYYFKRESGPKKFINFKGINHKKFKSDINEIIKGRYKSEEQKNAMKNIKTLYESQEKVIKLFNDYSKITSKAKYKSFCGEGLKISTPKQMLQRFRIAPA